MVATETSRIPRLRIRSGELVMMPYVSEFDFISFTLSESEVILTGWTVRQTIVIMPTTW